MSSPATVPLRTVVLVIEDEESYVDALHIGLTAEGFSVLAASTLAQARETLATTIPDLILLDVMLPDGSGIDFCRELLSKHAIPVIMVSARSSEVDVVLGLEIGAADYVTKPYRLRELSSRMRAILRRTGQLVPDDTIVFGEVQLDLRRRTLSRNKEEIPLSRKEFDLLALFANRLGSVVTREECIDALWWGLELSDTRSLDTHVKRLRQKIERVPDQPVHLLTIRGVGFRLDS